MPSADRDLSPSPPPNAPTALTPGPRATAFNNLYSSALSNTLKSISYDSFAACFPAIAEAAPESLKHMHANFISRLQTFATEEFNTILAERNVVENLNKLEDLIVEAKKRKARAADSAAPPTPPHTLPVDQIMHAHLDGVRASQQSQLNAKLQTMQSQNAILGKKMLEQREEIDELMLGLDRVVTDLEGAGETFGEQGTSLADGAREAEVVMGGVLGER